MGPFDDVMVSLYWMSLAQLEHIVAKFSIFFVIDEVEVLSVGIHCLDISNVEFLVQSLLLLGHHIDPQDLIGAI